MRLLTTLILSLVVYASTYAQTAIDSVLHSIEQHNTKLCYLRESSLADKLGYTTDIYLPDPQVEYGYQVGRPREVGSKTTLNISQSLDIPTLIGMKSRLAHKQQSLVNQQYQAERMALLLEARQCCLDLIYYTTLREVWTTRQHHAQVLSDLYRTRLRQGDTNLLEVNKVQLALSDTENELRLIELERQACLSQLCRLNGDTPITLNLKGYPTPPMIPDFDSWYISVETRLPDLSQARQALEIQQSQLSLHKASRLPRLSVSYTSEMVPGESFRGVSVGVSIPLWENANKVKQARAATRAAELQAHDTQRELYTYYKSLHERTLSMLKVVESYRQALSIDNHVDLLHKALKAGEISLLDYIVELNLYYDTFKKRLEAERDFHKSLSTLLAIDL